MTEAWLSLSNLKILESISTPLDLRKLSTDRLPQLADELRTFILDSTREKKGHIESSLAVTELSIALHYILETPDDRLFWDVGHQAYVHKVLTGRKDQFHTNRRAGGISGFPKVTESEYDLFTTGHSSTSISALTGMATASRLNEEDRRHVAVIGDGALTGGMAYEALNYLGESEEDVLIILNDNHRSIDENIGGLQGQQTYQWFFESLGIYYLGKTDGNNLETLIPEIRSALEEPGPRVLHVNTKVERLPDSSSVKKGLGFQEAMTRTLIEAANSDASIVALTPAMLSGSGLKEFMEVYPDRCFDVGIAEQHAVTMAAGLARAGMKPVCHLYSTFAQRAYDQIIHDVALQNLPVIFLLDRSGLVGADGSTHHGVFDLAYLNPIPNLVIASPSDPNELVSILQLALGSDQPFVIRYPRGGSRVDELDPVKEPLNIGKARWIRKHGGSIAVASLGHLSVEVEKALDLIPEVAVDHVDMRFLKPMDIHVVAELCAHDVIVTVENGCIKGGFGKSLALALRENSYQGRIHHLGLPDEFVEHGSIEDLYDQYGLSSTKMASFLKNL